MKSLKIGVISDIHGYPPLIKDQKNLEECDVICICGDVFEGIHLYQYGNLEIIRWVKKLTKSGKRVIAIPGNHDIMLYHGWLEEKKLPLDYYCRYIENAEPISQAKIHEECGIEFLVDETIDIDGFKIFGSPVSPRFCNWAWMYDEEKLYNEHFSKMENNIDIMLVHTPPQVKHWDIDVSENNKTIQCGSISLAKIILEKQPKHVFCGHIHSGSHDNDKFWINESNVVNVSYLGEDYKPRYQPEKLILINNEQ